MACVIHAFLLRFQCFVIRTGNQTFNRGWSAIWSRCGPPLQLPIRTAPSYPHRNLNAHHISRPCHSLGAQIVDPPPGYFPSATVLSNYGARSKQVDTKPLHEPPGTQHARPAPFSCLTASAARVYMISTAQTQNSTAAPRFMYQRQT